MKTIFNTHFTLKQATAFIERALAEQLYKEPGEIKVIISDTEYSTAVSEDPKEEPTVNLDNEAAEPTDEALEALMEEATELGVSFRRNIGYETLLERVNEAKAPQPETEEEALADTPDADLFEDEDEDEVPVDEEKETSSDSLFDDEEDEDDLEEDQEENEEEEEEDGTISLFDD